MLDVPDIVLVDWLCIGKDKPRLLNFFPVLWKIWPGWFLPEPLGFFVKAG